MPYPIHRGCYLFWPKCVGERLLSIGAPLTLGILTWLASRLAEKIDLRGTRLRVVVYRFHHYGVPSPHIGVFHGKNDYGRGYAEYCKTESILNAASKDIFASEGLVLLEFLFPSSDSLADWTQICDQMKNVKPDPIAFELRNANGDDFDPAFLCSIQQPVEISGEINSILGSDFVLGNRQKVTIQNYRRFFFEDDIWRGLQVSVKGELTPDPASKPGVNQYLLVPIEHDPPYWYPPSC